MSRLIIAGCITALLAACGSDEQSTDTLADATVNDLAAPSPDLTPPAPQDSAEEETSRSDSRNQPEIETIEDTHSFEEIAASDVEETRSPADAGSEKCGDNPVLVLQVYPLDIWAQLLKNSTITFADVDSGQELLQVDSSAVSIPLCDAAQYNVTVAAPNHDSLEVIIDFDGSDAPDAITMTTPGKTVAHVFTRTFKDFKSVPDVRHFTLWTGLPHHWFAPGAYPARDGNHLTLLSSGEEAWNAVASELSVATEQVLVTSWWWSSYFEIVRDPDNHLYLPPQTRWKNTIMGRLEELEGVERKVLINQFLTQDGFIGQYNVDNELIAKSETPGDQFEYMGMANPSVGEFYATPAAIDFSERLQSALGSLNLDEITISKSGLAAFSPPIAVDIQVPAILTSLNIPIASWHQKMVIVDGQVALVGGMNLTGENWDTTAHHLYDPRRMSFGASIALRESVASKLSFPDYKPAKDYMVRIQGPMAADVERVFASLWQYQLDKQVLYADLSTPAVIHALPEPIAAGANVVQAQLLMTIPAPFHRYGVLEALERAIARAQSYILIEDQYMRSPRLTNALKARMSAVPNLKLIIITNPINEWTNPACWQTQVENKILSQLFPTRFRTYRLRSFDAVDTQCSFCVNEVLASFHNHYMHSKLVIIDDLFLEVGSANHNNRSLLYDAEMAVAVYGAKWVRNAREKVTKEILGKYYKEGLTPDALFEKMEKAAGANQLVYEIWEDLDFEKNLNGTPVQGYLIPGGFLYPLTFGTPENCTFDNVGGDIM